MHVVDQHIANVNWSGKKVLVACSGGLDSTVLAHALHHNNISFALLHVNYQLRGAESDEDEQFVRELAETLQRKTDRYVSIHVERCPIELTRRKGVNLQQAARDFRREIFRQWTSLGENHCIVLAHHQDDQVETFFLQYFRGSGTFGLSGMEAEDQQLLRPLLNLPKSVLLEYAQLHNILWREDSSNATNAYLRNVLRNDLLPKLYNDQPQLRENVVLFQEKLREELHQHKTAATATFAQWIAQRFIPSESWKAQDELTQRLFIRELHQPSWAGQRLVACFDEPLSSEFSTPDLLFFRGKEGVHFQPLNAPEKIWEYKIHEGSSAGDATSKLRLRCDAAIVSQSLEVRSASSKDKIRLSGMEGRKSVWDLLKSEGIPKQLRSSVPVLVANGEVIWIQGVAVAKTPFTINGNSSTFWVELIEIL